MARASGGWRGKAGSRQDRGYGSDWERLRLQILKRDKHLCVPCLLEGRPSPAYAVDHITPKAKGGTDHPDNLRAICKACHAEKTAQEGAEAQAALRQEGKRRIGPDGWPIEPKVWGFSIPHGLRPSGIPVTIICGPPASGKTTYAHEAAKGGDKVIDLDAIKVRMGGTPYDQRETITCKAMAYRDMMIRSLADDTAGKAWLIVTAPTPEERAAWLEALGSMAQLVMMDADPAECIARIKADPARAQVTDALIEAVKRWQP